MVEDVADCDLYRKYYSLSRSRVCPEYISQRFSPLMIWRLLFPANTVDKWDPMGISNSPLLQ